MKRVTSVLIAILLGALTTGIGIVPFLVLANQDRDRLTRELEETRAWAEQAETEKNKIAEEANRKVEEANVEIQRAQEILEAVGEDQRLMAEATRLSKPSSRELYRWQHIVSLYQEVKLAIPPKTTVSSDTKKSLTVTREDTTDELFSDARWLAITPYDRELERELVAALGTSASVSYLINDHLLTGKQGVLKNGDEVIVLKARRAATSTHLIWMKDIEALGSGNGFERLLGTLEFNS